MDLPLRDVAIYNPDLLGKEELISFFVARKPLLERLLEDLRSGGAQHHMLVGPRGMGKTTMLRRLRFAIEDDPELARKWLPLSFPEEQYNIAHLSDLYLNCVDALGDTLDRAGRRPEARAIDRSIQSLPAEEARRREAALALLKEWAERLERGLVLLIDNVDIVLDRIGDTKEQWALREVLSSERRIVLIGTSVGHMETTYSYSAPFYEFFNVQELSGLPEREAREVLERLSDIRGTPQVRRILEQDAGRFRTIHTLSGGNPRTLVLLYLVLAQGTGGDARTDLEHLLDHTTPLYKARFEALSPQAQQIVDAVAIHWHPATAADIASKTRLDPNAVSSQLSRLCKDGVLEKVATAEASRMAFQVAERFFNIWYLMRASRRVRQRLVWLVEFLRLFHPGEELAQQARSRFHWSPPNDTRAALREAEYRLALADAVENRSLRRALEGDTIRALLIHTQAGGRIHEIVDLAGSDAELQPIVDRHRMILETRDAIVRAPISWHGWDAESFARTLLGAVMLPLQKKHAIARSLRELKRKDRSAVRENLTELVKAIEKGYEDLTLLVGTAAVQEIQAAAMSGELSGIDDVDGAKVAAERGQHRVLVVALSMQSAEAVAPEAELERALSKAPDVPYGWLRLGQVRFLLGKLEEAVGPFEKALELSAAGASFLRASAWWGIGVSHVMGRRFEEAECALRNATVSDEVRYHAWETLGDLYHRKLGRLHDAEHAYRQALDKGPPRAPLWLRLGDLLAFDLDRKEEGAEAYRQAVQLDPTSTDAWRSLGLVLDAGLERFAEAESAYRSALDLDDRDAKTWSWLGGALGAQKKLEDAESAYRSAIRYDPGSTFAWRGLSTLLSGSGRADEAEEAIRKSIALTPEHALSWYRLGKLLIDERANPGEAVNAYRKAAELGPDRAFVWRELGDALLRLDRVREAEDAYRAAVKANPEDAQAWCDIAMARLRAKVVDEETERAARMALSLRKGPGDEAVAAIVLGLRDRWDESFELFRRVLPKLSGEVAADDSREGGAVLILMFLAVATKAGRVGQAIGALDDLGLDEQWLPLRAALEAARDRRDSLLALAPEVRAPAEKVLAMIAGLAGQELEAPGAKPRVRKGPATTASRRRRRLT